MLKRQASLDKLGVAPTFAQPMWALGTLALLHLGAGLLALIATAPRFERTRPPPP